MFGVGNIIYKCERMLVIVEIYNKVYYMSISNRSHVS